MHALEQMNNRAIIMPETESTHGSGQTQTGPDPSLTLFQVCQTYTLQVQGLRTSLQNLHCDQNRQPLSILSWLETPPGR